MVNNMVMNKVNVFEVKAKLSEYLDRAAAGERILICRHNKPVAELVPVDAARTDERAIGPLHGRPTFEVPASFFEPLTEAELALWEADVAGGGPARVAEPGAPYSRTKARAMGGRRSARRRS